VTSGEGGRLRIAALILAAGESKRMGGTNKLLATIADRPLVRIVAQAALASTAVPVMVVTGHEAGRIEAALAGLSVGFVHNPDYAAGLSTSLRAGLEALPAGTDGAVVMLADMPEIGPAIIDRLIGAFHPERGQEIVVPAASGRRGNPVVWGARFFDRLAAAEGDAGGRRLIGEFRESVVEIDVGAAVIHDIDTLEALVQAGGNPA